MNSKLIPVLGRTGKQIEAAKRAQTKRLGQSGASGKSKKCKRGKSCGATCINQGKICLVDLPWVSSGALSKTATKIQSTRAINSPPTRQLKESEVKLSSLATQEDFKKKLIDTDGFHNPLVERMHLETLKILGEPAAYKYYNLSYKDDAERLKYERLRKKIEADLKGVSIEDASYQLKLFTSVYHKEIRDVQRGIEPKAKQNIEQYRLWGQNIERLLGLSQLVRPEVEKFRGFSASPEHLKGMIQAAQENKTLPATSTTSWSTSLPTAKKFSETSRKTGDTEHVIIRAINKTGIPIESITSSPKEYEVTTPLKSKYTYLNYTPIQYLDHETKTYKTYHIFDLIEEKG